MRIDSHQHFWRYRPETYPWIDERKRILKRDFLPEDLAPLLAAQRFDGCVAVQAAHTPEETRFLLELSDRHPFVRAVVGWVDLRAPDVEGRLAELARHPRLKGIRHIAQDEPDDRFLARADVLRGIAALEPFGLAYDVLVFARQLPAAFELVRRLSRQRFVLDHIAKPEIAAGRISGWKEQIPELAAAPNVCCKLSGLVTEAAWTGWTAPDFRPYLDVVFEAFGPDRLMIGSDWPVCLLAGDYSTVMGLVENYMYGRPTAEQDKVLGGNAARFYRIGSGGP